jgi:putative hydrolase of the HAD superfamily
MIEHQPVAATLFDFAGTLFDDRELRDVHLQQLRFVAEAAGITGAPDRELRDGYRRGMAVGYRAVAAKPSYLHRTLFAAAFSAMADALGGRIDGATAQDAVDRQYRATIDHAVLRPDCLATLRALRANSVHVGIVSNIDDEQLEPMLDRFGLREVIDSATSSESAGSCKPDAAIYRLALSKAGAGAAETLFVGDSLGHDVAGPATVGMRAAWLAPRRDADPGDARPAAVITTLAEVVELVRRGARR